MNKKRIIKIGIWTLVLGVLGYAAFSRLQENKTKLEADAKLSEQRNTVIPVITGMVGTAMWEGSFQVIGDFAPYKQVAVMSEVSGKVVSLNVDNGSYVRQGAILLSVDNDLLEIKLKTTRNNLAKAENDYKRLENLLGDGGITQQQLDDSKLAIDNLKAEIESIEKQLSMTYVKAPISGIVSNKIIEKGSLVAPAMKIADITNINMLEMQVYLTEEQVVTVKEGQQVSLRADILPEKPLQGKITFVDVSAGPSKRYLVEIRVDNPGGELKAGMTGTAFFRGGSSREVVAIPRESIVGNLQEPRVYVVDNDIARLRNIETGVVFDDKVQVKSGLEPGETIVVSGQINLEDGMNISIAEK